MDITLDYGPLGYVIAFFILLVYFADRIFIDGVTSIGFALVFSGAMSWSRAEAPPTSGQPAPTLDTRWRALVRWGLPTQLALSFTRFVLWLHSYLGDDQAVRDLEGLLYWFIGALQLTTTLGLAVLLLRQPETPAVSVGRRRVYVGVALLLSGVMGFAFIHLAFPSLVDR